MRQVILLLLLCGLGYSQNDVCPAPINTTPPMTQPYLQMEFPRLGDQIGASCDSSNYWIDQYGQWHKGSRYYENTLAIFPDFRKELARTIGEFFRQVKPETLKVDQGLYYFGSVQKAYQLVICPPDSSLAAFYRWLLKK
jgi:hypothetical protein